MSVFLAENVAQQAGGDIQTDERRERKKKQINNYSVLRQSDRGQRTQQETQRRRRVLWTQGGSVEPQSLRASRAAAVKESTLAEADVTS